MTNKVHKRRGFTCRHCGKWHGWYRHHKSHEITCQLKPAPVPRGPSRAVREKAEIKAALDAMVVSGELYVTPDGRYGLAAWNEPNIPQSGTGAEAALTGENKDHHARP